MTMKKYSKFLSRKERDCYAYSVLYYIYYFLKYVLINLYLIKL